MNRMTARLVFALSILLLTGTAFAGSPIFYLEDPSNPLDASAWDNAGGIILQTDDDTGKNVTVKLENGTATVDGSLFMESVYMDNNEKSSNVELSIDGANVHFTGGGFIAGTASNTATLTLTDAETGNPASLSFDGHLGVGANTFIVVENGSSLSMGDGLTIDDWVVEMPVPPVEGEEVPERTDPWPQTMHIMGGSSVSVAGTSGTIIYNGRVTVEGGSFDTTYFSMGALRPTNGIEIFVESGGTFRVTGTDREAYIGNGKFSISSSAAAVDFLGGVHVGAGGTMNVPIAMNVGANGMRVTETGVVDIDGGGQVLGSYFEVSNGGTLNANWGSFIGATDSFTVSGKTSTAFLSGYVLDGTKMVLNGGKTSFFSGFETVDMGYNPGALGALNIGGSADVLMMAEVKTGGGSGSFSFAGGDIMLQIGGKLNVGAVGNELFLGGNMTFDGGDAAFNDNVVWQKGGIFTMQGTPMATGPTIEMNNNRLSITANAIMDASGNSITIMDAQTLSISGTYRAGHNGEKTLMVSSVGGDRLYVDKNAKIEMSSALQRYVNSGGLDSEGEVLILATDSQTGAGVTDLIWNSGGYMYQYAVKQDSSGNWGVYVVGAAERTTDEQYNDLLAAWRPKVGPDVSKVITKEYAGAIIRANGIVTGASGDYDRLSQTGKYNADVLSSFMNPGSSGAGYDALMLYNGSGIAMANQAVINSGLRLLDRLEQRNTQLRHELKVASNSLGSSDAYASQLMNQDNQRRVWAAGHYLHDNSGWDEGFAGYHYRAAGASVGYDHLFGNLVLGGSFSYTGGDYEDSAALENDSYINTYAFHLYGAYNAPCSGWFINGAAGYAYSDNQLRDKRLLLGQAGWNTADFHTNTWMVAGNIGYDYEPTDFLTVTGSVGVQYLHAGSSSHGQFFTSEQRGGTSFATLNAGKISNHSTTLPVDLTVSYDMLGDEDSLLTLFGNAGYAYEFNNAGATGRISYMGLGNVGTVGVVSRHPGRHLLNVGGGAKYFYKQYEFGVSYDYVNRKKYNSHNFVGNVGIVF